MAVETFECHETASEPIEACEEAVGLINLLGLEGQRSLVTAKDDGPASRSPYREMTAEEVFVYQTICPTERKLAMYDASPIPLRVLQVAAHANDVGEFDELLVWDRASVTVKDPVLVGRKAGQYSWESKYYILARWGDELEAFATLLKRALKIKRDGWISQLEGIKASVDAEMSKVHRCNDADVIKAGATSEVSITLPF